MEAASKLSTLGKYSLIASLGQGGMAKVYLALMAGPAGFNKLLVVKALREDMHASSEEFVQMFLDEARLAARLNHPNIVQTYEVGEAEGRYFIAMEYLEGQSLRVVQRRLPNGIPLEHELYIMAETARGLHYAHELRGFNGEPLGVVHRDVSPQNVFLTYDGQVKLLDFGIAKTQDAEHLTKVGVIKGKIDYIAPEQIRGDQIDRRADVFALGAMLWEGVTGQRFAGGPKVADVTKIHTRVTGGEAKLRDLKPDVDEALAQIVDKAIALDPDKRYATALALADDLDQYLEQLPKKPSSKSLAELAAQPFEAERAKMRTLIDQQIQLAQRRGAVSLGETTGGLPRLGRTTMSTTRSQELDLTESGYPEFTVDSLVLPVIESTAPSSSYSKPTLGAEQALAALAAPQVAAAPVRRGPPKGLVFALVAGAMAGGLFLALRSEPEVAVQTARTESVVPRDPTEAPSPTPVATPDPAPAVQTVKIRIDATPADAQVTLDGSLLPKLPFTAELRKDGTMHHIEARAEGHEARRMVIPFDTDRELKIVLEAEQSARSGRSQPRRRGGGAGPAQPEAPTVASAPTAPPAPAAPEREPEVAPGADLVPSKPRARTGIDMSDPYAN